VKKRLILIVCLLLILGAGTLVYVGQRRERLTGLYYSGTIEATESNLSFQAGGRVKRVLIDEGQVARQGQLLAELHDEEFLARRERALADLERSEKILKQLEAVYELYRNTLPAEVDRAAAAVDALRAQLAEMEAGYRTQEVEQARLKFQAAKATMEEARKNKHRFDTLYEKRIIAEREKDAVDTRYETTLREYKRSYEAYTLLKEGYRKQSVEVARARLSEGDAVLRQARSSLKKIDAAEKDIEAAKAQVQSAMAALKLADIQLGYTRLNAPFSGILASRNIEPGEVVGSGREVLNLIDLSRVDLKVFVNETEIGKVKPGQQVEVKTDTFPEKTYTGKVSFISPEAEFTPKIIQTHKERVKLVYLVKISILNPELELKPGMPADAWFR